MPSVDRDLCGALVGPARVTCYAALDRKLTTKIVPWVPYLWASTHNVTSKNVTQWGFDQFGATIAYPHGGRGIDEAMNALARVTSQRIAP